MSFYLFCLNSHCRDSIMKKTAGTPTNFALENQAIKRQKLDGGRSRQVSHYCFLASPYLLCFFVEVYLNCSFSCLFLYKNLRFLMSNPKFYPTSPNWVLLVTVPVYALRLLRLAKMRERFVIFRTSTFSTLCWPTSH